MNYPALRRTLKLALAVGFLLTACSAPAASQPKSITVGVVNGGKNLEVVLDGFKAGMAELGYVEGKTITYSYDGAADSPDKVEPIAQKQVNAKVDLILSIGTAGTLASQKLTKGTDLPVLFVPVGGPVQAGIVQSMKNPGANVTGIATGLDYHAQRLEWLTKIAPKTKRVYVPYNSGDTSPSSTLPVVQQAAAKLGLDLVLRECRTNDDVTAAIQNIPADIDSIFMLPDSLVNSRLADFVKVANDRKLPLSVHFTSMASGGALYSYGYDQAAAGKQAARLADRILKGTKPADLPVETTEYNLTINLKTAQALGLTIPDDVIRQAATVIR